MVIVEASSFVYSEPQLSLLLPDWQNGQLRTISVDYEWHIYTVSKLDFRKKNVGTIEKHEPNLFY